jgi:hypothetical protein
VTDLVTVEEIQILAQQPDDSVLVDEVEVVEIVAVAEQGPPGRDATAVTGALTVANRLSEFVADPQAQADAQQNIGLGAVDPLAYYILAKA